MTVGERIKKMREALGITQTELASQTRISKQNLYKYENNIITNIPSDKIEIIAKKLGTTPAILMGWNTPNETTSSKETTSSDGFYSSNDDTDKRIRLLARHIDEIPLEHRERILNNFENTLSMYLDAMGINVSEE